MNLSSSRMNRMSLVWTFFSLICLCVCLLSLIESLVYLVSCLGSTNSANNTSTNNESPQHIPETPVASSTPTCDTNLPTKKPTTPELSQLATELKRVSFSANLTTYQIDNSMEGGESDKNTRPSFLVGEENGSPEAMDSLEATDDFPIENGKMSTYEAKLLEKRRRLR